MNVLFLMTKHNVCVTYWFCVVYIFDIYRYE